MKAGEKKGAKTEKKKPKRRKRQGSIVSRNLEKGSQN